MASKTIAAHAPASARQLERAMHEVLRNMMNPAWWTVDRVVIAVCFAVIFGTILKGSIDELRQ
jgi:hypothetical protein